MTANTKAFVVTNGPEGFGEVFALYGGQRYTLGRAHTNEIVLKDNLCSRQHAEIYFADGHWRVRDCGSMNGTRVNDDMLDSEWELSVGDEIGLGHTRLLFVNDLSQLPAPKAQPSHTGVSIRKRLGQTRYDLVGVALPAGDVSAAVSDRQRISRDLSMLYCLALDMGSAVSYEQLIQVVLKGLLDGTSADAGGVLSVKEDGRLEVTAHRSKGEHTGYVRVADSIAEEVIRSKEAILAEDQARIEALKAPPAPRTSLSSSKKTDSDTVEIRSDACSLICAPVVIDDKVKALIHLFCADPMKSLDTEDLEFTVAVCKQLAVASRGLQRQIELAEENQRLKAQVTSEVELVGKSLAVREVENQIARVAGTNAIVLIRGESGAGKELVARAIHLASQRRNKPFVCLNCAALTESLLESELFGHEKGAFTGATDRKIGKFEAANGGTIFLDEIGEMHPNAQAKLLRILEGHPYERVGGHELIRVNVRVVAATNRPLEEAVNAGQFRRDLYFRLQVVEIRVAPLRERRDDIPLLAEHFLQRFLRETGRKVRGFTPAAMQKMEVYHWPGNVRELRNVVERAVALGSGLTLDTDDIWLSGIDGQSRAGPHAEGSYAPRTIEDLEKQHIRETLEFTHWNKSQAANILGIERSTLDRKIRLYAIAR